MERIIAALHLLDSGNLEVRGHSVITDKHTENFYRMCAVQALWNDKRLTKLLDQWIAADKGEA